MPASVRTRASKVGSAGSDEIVDDPRAERLSACLRFLSGNRALLMEPLLCSYVRCSLFFKNEARRMENGSATCGTCGTTTGATGMRRGHEPAAAVWQKNEGQEQLLCHRFNLQIRFLPKKENSRNLKFLSRHV